MDMAGGTFQKGLKKARTQSQRCLIEKHRNKGEQHPGAVGGGQGDGGEPVQNGLCVQDGAVSGQPFGKRPHNGHGPDAVDQGGRDQPVGEPGVFGPNGPFEPGRQTFEEVLQPEQFPSNPAQKHRADHHQRIFNLQGHLHADKQHTQPEPLKNNLPNPVRKTAVQGDPHKTAHNNGRGIDHGTSWKHIFSPTSYLRLA